MKTPSNLFNVKTLIIATLGFMLFIIPSISSIVFAVDVAPAPPSIGAGVPLTYFGPAPSMVQRELIGPYQLLNKHGLCKVFSIKVSKVISIHL